MPKSKRSNKKIQQRQKHQVIPTPQVEATVQAVAQPQKPAPVMKPSHGVSSAVMGNPFIGREMKAIGAVTAIMIVILVIAFVFLG